MTTNHKKISRLLSLVLRHRPEKIGIRLNSKGWAKIDKLILAINEETDFVITRDELEEIVRTNDKQRFSFDAHGTMIRANQGHSVSIDLQLKKTMPPEILYHGTSSDNCKKIIKSKKIDKMRRHHVHLYDNIKDATQVGSQRSGKVALIQIHAKQMWKAGFKFYRSKNGVWLTDYVPLKYINLKT